MSRFEAGLAAGWNTLVGEAGRTANYARSGLASGDITVIPAGEENQTEDASNISGFRFRSQTKHFLIQVIVLEGLLGEGAVPERDDLITFEGDTWQVSASPEGDGEYRRPHNGVHFRVRTVLIGQ